MKYIFVLILLLLQPFGIFAEENGRLIDDFENGLRPEWKEKVFKGRTDYRVVREATGNALQAESHGAASALILEQAIDLKESPVLSWRWKVEKTLAKGDARSKAGDDYAARIYVIFPHWFFPKTRAINYIWANKLPLGTVVPNSFTSRAIMIAVQSGEEHVGKWMAESRNVRADYRAIFGEEPPLAGAIAVMTDTDNTGGSAVAWYDDIRLKAVADMP
jgi:Protein of unknown function (DUF3047)